jgi:hypothetical protein
MTAPNLYFTWGGLEFGENPAGDGVEYEVAGIVGLDSFSTSGGTVDAPGRDGAALAPLWLTAPKLTLSFDLYGPDEATLVARRKALAAATVPTLDRYSEAEFGIFLGTEQERTCFARVTDRNIPGTVSYLVDRYAEECDITWLKNDPLTYWPEQTSGALDRGDYWTFSTPSGTSVPSQRWQWVAHGPLVNPKMTVTIDGFADVVLRFYGTVNSGQNLNVEVTPHRKIHTVGGPSFNRRSDFDGGNRSKQPPFNAIAVMPGEQTWSFDADSGSGTATFTARGAML